MQNWIGKELGNFRIEAKIGQGGMAEVFKAYQASLDRYVALKVLRSDLSADPDFVERFQREAKSIALLQHPHILGVHDYGVDQGYSYTAMKYVETGQTLDRVLRQSLSQERAIELITQIGGALAFAHEKGIVHRDVKPSNVLMDGDWPLLSDFGLARIGAASTDLTRPGACMGTPAYMSPEQLQGEEVDHRSDIYALGIMLYQMLTGTIPHNADNPLNIMINRCCELPPSPRKINPDISVSVAKVVLRALAIRPEERYDSATDFVEALQEAAVERWPPADPPVRPLSYPPFFVLKRYLRFAGVVTLAIGVTWVGILFWRDQMPGLSPSPPVQPLPTVTSTPTATNSPNLTFTPTLAPTIAPVPATLTPTPSATHTPMPPTSTPTSTVAPTPTLAVTSSTPTIRPTSTSSIPSGTFTLLRPDQSETVSRLVVFEWKWTGEKPPEYGFEVRVWREEEKLPLGVRDAVLENREIESIGENTYRLTVDIKDAPGVQGRSGEYLWTVVLVQINPDYKDLGIQASPNHLHLELDGAGSDDGSPPSGGITIKP